MTALCVATTPGERIAAYRPSIKKTKGQLLIIAPEVADVQWLAENLRSKKKRMVILTGAQSKASAWASYTAFATGSADLLIGTRLAALAPAPRLAHLFIDRDEDPSHASSDRHPHYDARDILDLRSRLERVPLTIVSETPRVTRFPLFKKDEAEKSPSATVVSLSNHWRSGAPGFLTLALDGAIERALIAKRQTILFLNRKGYANLLECRECHELITERGALFCPRCHCPDLKERKPGIARIAADVKKRFPDASVAVLERSREGQIPLPYPAEADITITTEVFLHWYRMRAYDEKIGCIGILFPDPLWHRPDYRANETALAMLRGFRNIAAARGAEYIIQTADPDSRVIRALVGDLETFYTEELADRKAVGYPPYDRNMKHET